MQLQISMREAFGLALAILGYEYPKIVVLDADVSSSTRTILFGEKHPERFFNVGVAEANLIDIAGGMATCGLKPVVSAFALFLSLKGAEQIRNVICYNRLPVVMVGGYSGLSDSFDGASHQAIEDIAVMRALPNMHVLVPSDVYETEAALKFALELNEPVYLRLGRNPLPAIFDRNTTFNFHQISPYAYGSDLTIAVCGTPSFMAVEALEKLNQLGVKAELLIISSLKPIDITTIANSVMKTKRLLVIEEHTVYGGLRSAILDQLPSEISFQSRYIGINDTFGETGPYFELLAKFGICVENIINESLLLKNTI